MKSRYSIVVTQLLIIFITLLLAGCGSSSSSGGGAGGGGGSAPATAASPTLTFAVIKNFRFDWTDVGDATFYKLLENPDGVSGYSQVGSDITQGTQTVDHIVPLYARLNAVYILQSCNATGCTDSSAVSVTTTLATAIGYVKASNTGVSDTFGSAVSLSADGNTLAVGAYQEDSSATGIDGDGANDLAIFSGAVYVFSRSGSGWTQQAYIKASNTEAGDRFGTAVSLSADGNTLAVGAAIEESNATGINGDDTNNLAAESGAVYVFSRSGSGWTQQAYIKASNTEGGDRFGFAVSLSADGNTLAVGAIQEDSIAIGIDGDATNNSAIFSGAVYVFSRSGSVWTQQAYVKAGNTGAGDRFGTAVSLSADGNTLAVGAYQEGSFAGAVYVFARSGSTWAQQAYVKASNTGAGDAFGWAVSLSADGNTLAVGAIQEDSNTTGINGDGTNNSAFTSGAVYVFSRSGSAWTQQAYVKAGNTGTNDRFGTAVSLSADGNTLAVGSLNEDSDATGLNGDGINNLSDNSGAVYVFSRSGSVWTQQAYVKASNTGLGDSFGIAVSLSADGNSLAVAAIFEASSATGINGDQADDTAAQSGAVYLF